MEFFISVERPSLTLLLIYVFPRINTLFPIKQSSPMNTGPLIIVFLHIFVPFPIMTGPSVSSITILSSLKSFS